MWLVASEGICYNGVPDLEYQEPRIPGQSHEKNWSWMEKRTSVNTTFTLNSAYDLEPRYTGSGNSGSEFNC